MVVAIALEYGNAKGNAQKAVLVLAAAVKVIVIILLVVIVAILVAIARPAMMEVQ